MGALVKKIGHGKENLLVVTAFGAVLATVSDPGSGFSQVSGSVSGSGSMMAKMTHKSREKIMK
jgi:hypothetical protein